VAKLPAEQDQRTAPAAVSTAAGTASVAPKLMPVSVVVSETDSSDDEEEGSEDSERTVTEEKQIDLLTQQCDAVMKRQQQQQQQQLIKSDDRANGDAACASGQWSAALRHYNAAISANPSDVRALASRSQVFIKLKRPGKVEKDASAALQLLRQLGSGGLDAASARALRTKLLYRRAVALKESGKYKEAIAVSRESPSQHVSCLRTDEGAWYGLLD